jgi:hypothetical protein
MMQLLRYGSSSTDKTTTGDEGHRGDHHRPGEPQVQTDAECPIRLSDIATTGRGMRPVPVLNKTLGEFSIGAGRELYPDGRVPKVDPVADVPRSDRSGLCECFEASCELPDAKNPASYRKSYFGSLRINHHTVSPTASWYGRGPFAPAPAEERGG